MSQTEDELPPWQQPGNYRRDGEPHRGPMLLALATVGLTVSVPGCCLSVLGLSATLVNGPDRPLGDFLISRGMIVGVELLGLALGLLAWLPAKWDVAGMKRGAVDPAGQWDTQRACSAGLAWVLIAVLSLCLSTLDVILFLALG
jgi:hypothetical protein